MKGSLLLNWDFSHWPIYWVTPNSQESFAHSFIHSLAHSFICSFIDSIDKYFPSVSTLGCTQALRWDLGWTKTEKPYP